MRLDQDFFGNVDIEVNKVLVAHLLDCSGSMYQYNGRNLGRKIDVAINSIRKENDEIKVDYVGYVPFSTTVSRIHERWEDWKTNIQFATLNGGVTALNDAIVYTLSKLLREYKDDYKILLKIYTDGEENRSSSSIEDARTMIQAGKDAGMSISFIGTEKDVQTAINLYKIDESNTQVLESNTAEGFAKAMTRSYGATMSMVSTAQSGGDITRGFYSKEVRN